MFVYWFFIGFHFWNYFHCQQFMLSMASAKPRQFTLFTRDLTIFWLPVYCINKAAKNMAWLFRHSVDRNLARNCNRHYLALLLPKSTLFTLRRRHDPIVLLALIYSHFGMDCSTNKNQTVQNLLDPDLTYWRNYGGQAPSDDNEMLTPSCPLSPN